MPPAGLAGGTFRLGDEEVRLEGGRISLPDGTIAGGAATMDTILYDVVGQAATLPEAVRMAATVPAAVAGAGATKGRIAAGFDADFVALDWELGVAATWVGGRLAHASPGFAGVSG
jgi:N-acetylglucosamine-6-phosphate deacetylase